MHVVQFCVNTQTPFLFLIVNFVLGSLDSGQCSVVEATVTRGARQDGPLILTPLLDHGRVKTAKMLSKVDSSLFSGVNSHAGYFTVDKTRKWNLFFWYFPAEGGDLESTPLVSWLQGGPGVSSLFGLYGEIGPLQIINRSVQKMNITWGSNYSLLFIDNPVGTGFSFSEGREYATNMDAVGLCLLSFIQQFLQVFPELRRAPLFLAGESYAGKYLPAFGHYIRHNKDDTMPINLRGLVIGAGWIDPPTMLHYANWGLEHGLIDHKQNKEISKLEYDARRNWRQNNVSAYKQIASKAIDVFFTAARVDVYNYINGEANKDTSPLKTSIETFLNKPEVQTAIHVKKMKFSIINNIVYEQLRSDEFLTVKPWLEELVEYYGVLCYNGQLDMIVPYAVSVHTYRSLNWSGRQGYLNADRQYLYDEENSLLLNSFVTSSGNFMEAMVVGAGHLVATDKPRAAKQIIDMFIKRHKVRSEEHLK